ncbi:TPA: DUF637 domain-containing protein [Yersinia enterocolitica]|nr:DUF637 domain-containing protein [Yersinia enterocolitica]HDL6897655.1 DUF637 domain-containing protein [Yersinia enterocolitica]
MAEFSNTRTRIASWLLIYLTAVQPLHPAIAAGIQADNRQTKVHIRGQIPVVDIVAPNAAGISHNRYRDFNVATAGAVLNNATTTGNSALVGRLAANPHLTRNSAQLIINEVTGHQSSVLEGQLEVFGQKADMIIANPNGLYCNGCNFSNTSGITLTTGRPVFNSQGELDSLNITKNTAIIVGSKGVNALNQNNTAIITGGLKLHGEIRANQLDVILGTNQVNYQSGDIQSLLSKETKPLIVLDTKELGGMYANSIRLISTEKANTVNAKNIVSHKGDIRFDVAGDLNLSNITAKNNLNITSKKTSLAKGDKLLSGRDITLVNTEFNNLGQVTAEGDLRIFSDQVRNSGQQAHIIASNNMWIQKDSDGNKNTLIENKSGTIKTKNGDLIIRTEKLENSRQIFNTEWQGLEPDSREMSFLESGNSHRTIQQMPEDSNFGEIPKKWFGTVNFDRLNAESLDFIFTVNSARSHYKTTAISPAATLYSGGNIYINATLLNNHFSNFEAKKDIFLTGSDFFNTSTTLGTKNIFNKSLVEVSGDGEYYAAGLTEYPEQSQWQSTLQHQGIIKSIGNIVIDFKENINLQNQSPAYSSYFDEIIIEGDNQPTLQGNNIVLHANDIISNAVVQAQGEVTVIADNTVNLSHALITGKNVTITALNNINSSYSGIGGHDITLLSRQGNVQFNSPGTSRYFWSNEPRPINLLNSTGDLTIVAGLNIRLLDTLLHSGKSITMTANNNIELANTDTPLQQHRINTILTSPQKQKLFNRAFLMTSYLTGSDSITLTAGKNIVLQGITLESEQDINLHAAHDILLNKRELAAEFNPYFPASRTPELSTQINSKGNLLINAGRDILTHASHIATDNNMTLLAGRNIQLAAQLYAGEGQRQDKHEVTQLQAGKALNMVASDQLLAYGAELTSAGDMTLTSGGNMRFESLLNEQHQGGGDNFSYNKLQQPTQLNSGGILTLIANGSILFQATQLMAKKVMDIAAKGGYLFAQAMEETSHSEQHWQTRKWWGRKKSHHNVQHVATNKVTEFTAEGDISLLSRDDSTYQASKIAAGQNAKLTSTHGKVIFEAVKDITFQQKTELSKGFYIKYTDKGYLDEKWVLPTIHTGGELTVDAAQGIRADVKVKNGESLRSAITALSKTPGNEWLNDLNLRDDVQWQKVMDAYHHWDHKNEHLNPVVAAVIAIAIAAATAGSGLVVAAGAAAGGGVAGGAVSAGMSALASQAAVSLMNNKGDISKTFKDMGSKSSVKSLVTSMAIGGALSGFDAAIGGDSAAKGAKTASTTSARLPQLSHGDWSKVAQRVAGQSIISSSLNTAINGGSFKDNLATALLTSAGSQLHAEGAHLIGDDGAVLGVSGKALSHALVAGVAAEIGGGNAKGAAAGALAAELAGVVMGDNIVGSQQWQEKQAQFSRVAGAIAGVLATGKVEGAYSGANAGEVVDRFNRQLHLDEIKAVNELAKGSNVKQERFLAASCRQVNCTAQEALNSAERARAELLMAKYPETPEEDGILRNYWIQKEKKRFGNYPALTGFEQIQLFTYADADKLSDSQKFAKNQWVEEASNLTGWSREAVEALGISASLAGVVRGKRFGQTGAAYPTGISFNINQKNHLANFDGFSQRKGIHGTHNADAFNQAVSSNGVKIISRTSGSVNGITHIKYQIPAKDRAGNTVGYKAEILEKTIYDPKVFSDQKMLMLGQQAAANGYQSARNSGVREYKAISDGVKFQIYLDQQTGSVINFFPVIK